MRSAALILLGALLLACQPPPKPDPLVGVWRNNLQRPLPASGQGFSEFTEYKANGSFVSVTHSVKPFGEWYHIIYGTWKRDADTLHLTEDKQVIKAISGNRASSESILTNKYTHHILELSARNLVKFSWEEKSTYEFTRDSYPSDMDPAIISSL